MYSLTLLIIQKCHNLYSSESDFEQQCQNSYLKDSNKC